MDSTEPWRRLPAGAEPVNGGVHFRVWAPDQKHVSVVSDGRSFELALEGNSGYFSGSAELKAGKRYKFRLESGEYPDPASRFQPEGPHGPSQVIDPGAFAWTDAEWKGIPIERAVIYELHTGTFTPEGTWAAAMGQLPVLKELGINVIELMPVADFSGRFGWGYDGVNLFAPTRLYGSPDDLRRLVNTAHSLKMAVILDVVYNHLGADGNYLGCYTKHYFSEKHTTDWGDAINFDGPDSGPVRDFFISNAGYWIDEFHFDGLRLDATQNIYDDSEPHVLAEITRRVRDAARGRTTIVVAENEPQQTRLVRCRQNGGYAMDGLWNDDFHHSAVVALTGHNDAYYTDYLGEPQEFVSAAKYGYLYQGQRYKWQNQRRGTSTRGIPPAAFVTFIENHDQVANSGRGDRVWRNTSRGRLKAMTALVLAGPGTPMLFQGQEFLSSAPFVFFADVPENLAPFVRKGRKEFMHQWQNAATPEMDAHFDDPCSEATFEKCKLDFSERAKNRDIYEMHADLLRLRREDPVLSSWRAGEYDGAVLGGNAFLLRAFSEQQGDRLIVVNLGRDLNLNPAPEPLLAPPEGMRWDVMLSTEHPRYGGCGTPEPDSAKNWRIPGDSALILKAVAGEPEEQSDPKPSEKEERK